MNGEPPVETEQAISDDQVHLEDIEIRLLLEAIYQLYGYDFRSYSQASMRRRIMHRLTMSGFSTVLQMTDRVLRDRQFFVTLLNDLTVNVTEMYRDPDWRTVRLLYEAPVATESWLQRRGQMSWGSD